MYEFDNVITRNQTESNPPRMIYIVRRIHAIVVISHNLFDYCCFPRFVFSNQFNGQKLFYSAIHMLSEKINQILTI